MIKSTHSLKLKQELLDGVPYDYYPLGEYIVVAPGICGGRPTFKYTRLEVSHILSVLADGHNIEHVVSEYQLSHLTREAIQEAIRLADKAFVHQAQTIYPLAV